MDTTTYALLFSGGLIAGAINAVAGAGSIITLSLLIEFMGLPANIANGTNRVGVLMNALGSGQGYLQNKAFNTEAIKKYLLPTVLGGVGGILLALNIDNKLFLPVFRYLLVFFFILLLWQPKKWIASETSVTQQIPQVFVWILLFLVGFYGGFIQMGMGLFFLGVMVLGCGETLRIANPIKILSVFLFTILALFLFARSGMIYWIPGLCLGAGQWIGGWLLSKYQNKIPDVDRWIYRLLLLMVLLSIIKAFGLLNYIFN